MKVKQVLTTTKVIKPGQPTSSLIFGDKRFDRELAVRQYLLARLAGLEFNKACLCALGAPGSAVVYPMPSAWRAVLETEGFNVARRRSALLWNIIVLRLFLYGILRALRQIAVSAREALTRNNTDVEAFAYFDQLTGNNLPKFAGGNQSHDIISWYSQWSGRPERVRLFKHSVRAAPVDFDDGKRAEFTLHPVPPLNQLRSFIQFCIWAIAAAGLAGTSVLFGRWWNAVMFREATLRTVTRLQDPKRLGTEYLFHNSGWIYRPLWTYEAEAKGSRITFYFYSTNIEAFRLSASHVPPSYGYEAMSWPRYLVWDEYQSEFVRKMVGSTPTVSIVGQIWFESNAVVMPSTEGSAISVFDVSPCRESFYVTLGIELEFYTIDVSLKFLSDISEVAKENELEIFWKRKRGDRPIFHPRYRRFTKTLERLEKVTVLDPATSANRVIEHSDYSISMPFTSTALIAREMGKPSCYYDPLNLLTQDDPAAHGIPIVQGRLALSDWVRSNVPLNQKAAKRSQRPIDALS